MKKAFLFLGCLGIASITLEGLKPIDYPGTTVHAKLDSAPTLSHPLVDQDHPSPYIREIACDLVANKLVDHVDKLAFTLDSSVLIVNGIRQNDDIYLKFRSKYIKHARDRFIYAQHYSPNGSSIHTDVNIDHFGPPI